MLHVIRDPLPALAGTSGREKNLDTKGAGDSADVDNIIILFYPVSMFLMAQFNLTGREWTNSRSNAQKTLVAGHIVVLNLTVWCVV